MMPRLWLDFERPPGGYRWPGMAVLIAATLSAVWLIAQYLDVSATVEARTLQTARLKRDIERHQLFGAASEQTRSVGTAAKATRSAAYWDNIFTGLEAASDETVTLLGMDTSAEGVTLTGEAKNLSAVTAYVTRLQRSADFAKAYIAEQSVFRMHARQPTRFTIIAPRGDGAKR